MRCLIDVGGVLNIFLSASSKLNGWSETDISFFFRGLDMSIQTPIASGRWRYAEARASSRASASCQCRLEDIGVLTVVEAPLKLVQIKRQIFLADVVVRADYPALQQGPKAVQIRSMNEAAHVLTFGMVNGLVRIAHRVQVPIAGVLIGGHQINLVADGLAHEIVQRLGRSVLDDLADYVAFAADRADYRSFTDRTATSADPLVAMFVLFLAADISLIDFDLAHKLREVVTIIQHRSHAMADIESGLIGSRATGLFEHPLNLERTNTFLALANEIDNFKPDWQRIIGILEYRADQRREAIAILFVANPDFAGLLVHALSAALADPIPSAILYLEYLLIAATRAPHALWPAQRDKQIHAGIFGVVLFVNLSKANHEQTLHLNGQWCQVRNNSQESRPWHSNPAPIQIKLWQFRRFESNRISNGTI